MRKNFYSQPFLGISMSLLGVVVLLYAWQGNDADFFDRVTPFLLVNALFLFIALVFATRFPIHLRYHIKLYVSTIPLFLIVVLLPAPLAAAIVGAGIFMSELSVRATKGNYLSDVLTATGRWIGIAFAASTIAHWSPQPLDSSLFYLLLSALTMLSLDMVTASFEIAAMSGESPVFVFMTTVRESFSAEIVQYAIAFFVALAAERFPLVLLLFSVPSVVIYWAFKDIKEMRESTRKLMEDLADAVDLRDAYTGGHSRRVAQYCADILREMKLAGVEAELIVAAARVHDIGKLNLPLGLVNKPGSLTPEELELMQTHPDAGANLLARYPNFARGREIVRHHHERWDGQGYPHKLKALEIPLGARVIAVADSFDAMTTDRPYRKGMTAGQAVMILERGKAQQWDAHIVDSFVSSLSEKIQQDQRVAIAETQTASVYSFAS